MLIQLGVNPELAKCHSVARRIPGSIIVWNGNSSYYEVAFQTKSQIIGWAALLATGGCLFGINALAAWKSEDVGMSSLCGFFSFAAPLFAATSLTFRENGSDTAAFLNGLLSLANNRKDKAFQEILRPTALGKLLARNLVASQIMYPWLLSCVALVWPCSPLNMFSSVSGWCGGGDGDGNSVVANVGWLSKVATGIVTAVPHLLFWKAYFCQAVMASMHLFLGSLCQKTLQQFMSQNRLDDSRSADFASSDWKLYRSCQILNICFNNYCSHVGLAIIAAIVVGEISTSYLVFTILAGPSNHLPLLIQLILSVLCPTFYLFHMMAVGEGAAVHSLSLSKLTKGGMETCVRVQQAKLTRRLLRSAWPLKTKVGESNFIEAATALVMLDFSVRRLVDLLLIGG